MIHEYQLHPDSILDALSLMAQMSAFPIDSPHAKWGEGARTESRPICTADICFGAKFWKSVSDTLTDFHFDCLMDGHTKNPTFFIEKEPGAFHVARFVCVSGPHKQHD